MGAVSSLRLSVKGAYGGISLREGIRPMREPGLEGHGRNEKGLMTVQTSASLKVTEKTAYLWQSL